MFDRLLSLFIGIMIILNGATRIPSEMMEGIIVMVLGVIFVLCIMRGDSDSMLNAE